MPGAGYAHASSYSSSKICKKAHNVLCGATHFQCGSSEASMGAESNLKVTVECSFPEKVEKKTQQS